jgi:hypothetical protein
MARQDEYISSETGIDAYDVGLIVDGLTAHGRAQTKVYLVDLATGKRTPVKAIMLDNESDDAPSVYLYTEHP